MVILQCAPRQRLPARLGDPAATATSHYVVDEDGNAFRLAAEERLACQAGVSRWRGRHGLDRRAISVALVHAGDDDAFPVLQLAAVCDLCLDILSRHAVPARNFVGLGDVAPERSQAPGGGFDWEGLARNDVGLWPADVPDLGTGEAVRDAASLHDVRAALAHIGYAVAPQGGLDPALSQVLRAFQRHWRPEAVTGQADSGTLARLLAVARLCA
jgi:N-acetylmuramoyl-L-alanine amidase